MAYDSLFSGLKDSGTSLETAREDARYVLPLATTSQMGMTANARELEHMFRRLSAHPLEEVRELGTLLLKEASSVAPSLFLFTEPAGMDGLACVQPDPVVDCDDPVTLAVADDDSTVGIHLLQASRGISLEKAAGTWDSLDTAGREALFTAVFDSLGIHDPPPRCWETFRACFEVIVSATAYAQLKRHRMSTQILSRYDPGLGYTVPPSVEDSGLTGIMGEAMERARNARSAIGGAEGDYLLTNAHRRRVTLQMNGRELYHFSRLREDCHAQWDIRGIARSMMDLLREHAPLTMKLSGGKSETDLPGGEVQ
jgi:thymidylate synthase ThyX